MRRMGAVSSIVPLDATTGVVRRLLSRLNVREAIFAALSSIAAGVVDFGVLIVLVERGVPVAVAAFIAATCGAVVNFVCSKYLAFCDRTPLALRQTLSFAGVSLAGALFIALAMELCAVGLGVPYVLAKLLCSTLVFAAWTYPAQRYLTAAGFATQHSTARVRLAALRPDRPARAALTVRDMVVVGLGGHRSGERGSRKHRAGRCAVASA